MPGSRRVGMKFYQEQAKGVAMDRVGDRQPDRALTTRARDPSSGA